MVVGLSKEKEMVRQRGKKRKRAFSCFVVVVCLFALFLMQAIDDEQVRVPELQIKKESEKKKERPTSPRRGCVNKGPSGFFV